MFERCTEKAVNVIRLAQEEASRLNHIFVDSEHILLGLFREGTSIATKDFNSQGINLETARNEVEKIVGRGYILLEVDSPFGSRFEYILKLACAEADYLDHNYIEPEHLLLGLLRDSEGVAVRVLQNFYLDLNTLRRLALNQIVDRSSQVIVEGGNVENILIEGDISQEITQQCLGEYYIRPNESVSRIQEILPFAQQSIIKDSNAKNIILLGTVKQIINWLIVNNNYIINDEIVEQLVENVATLLAPNANLEVKKSLILQVVRECANSGCLPLSPEDESFIHSKLCELSLQKFNALLSSDKKYKKLRNRLGWYIAGGAGAGFTAGSASGVDLREIIHDLIDELSSGGGREPYPPSSNPLEQDDLERTPRGRSSKDEPIRRRSSNDEFIRRLTPLVPYSPNIPAQPKSPKGQFPPEQSGVVSPARKTSPSSENSLSKFPSSSSGGGGSLNQSQNQALENLIENNLVMGVGSAIGVNSAMSGGASESQASGSGGDCGDCGGCDVGDCDPGCFIATAVYGSDDVRQVVTLRRFRDEKLMLSLAGRLFIATYYQLSPPFAQWLKNVPRFAKPVRFILDRLVAWLEKN
jgi:hypothetical protein